MTTLALVEHVRVAGATYAHLVDYVRGHSGSVTLGVRCWLRVAEQWVSVRDQASFDAAVSALDGATATVAYAEERSASYALAAADLVRCGGVDALVPPGALDAVYEHDDPDSPAGVSRPEVVWDKRLENASMLMFDIESLLRRSGAAEAGRVGELFCLPYVDLPEAVTASLRHLARTSVSLSPAGTGKVCRNECRQAAASRAMPTVRSSVPDLYWNGTNIGATALSWPGAAFNAPK
jgi:hypothetical protein